MRIHRFLLSFIPFTMLLQACGAPSESPVAVTSDHEEAIDAQKFPLVPNGEMTPGELCSHENSQRVRLRYPEKILYCKRSVNRSKKDGVIKAYDQELGFSVGRMQRSQFKVDHYIPLCAGGANTKKNLWPQHQSVYRITDPVEPRVCALMSLGGIKQSEVVELVKEVKADHSTAAGWVKELDLRIAAAKEPLY